MPTILSVPLSKNYYAKLCSRASFLTLIFLVAALILPFVFAYASQSFWLKQHQYRETPALTFTKQIVLVAYGSNPSPFTINYSTNEDYNLLFSSSLRNPIIQISNLNSSRFVYNVKIPLAPNEAIHHVKVAFLIRYDLKNLYSFQTHSMLLVDVLVPQNIIALEANGNVKLKVNGLFPKPSLLVPVFDFTNVFRGVSDISWNTVLKNYYARSAYTTVELDTISWTPGTSSSSFSINGVLKIPEETIIYQPGLLEVLKHGWIQYLAYVVLIWAVLYPIFRFLIVNGIVGTFIKVDKSGNEKIKLHSY